MNHLPTNPTIGDLVRAGALGRALRRLAQGWREDSLLLNLEASYPGAQPEQYREILRLAYKSKAAADRQATLPPGQRLDAEDIPLVPPG